MTTIMTMRYIYGRLHESMINEAAYLFWLVFIKLPKFIYVYLLPL